MRGSLLSVVTGALLCCLTSATTTRFELLEYDSVADAGAVILSSNARFTVLTPSIIRMEYSSSGKFEDRPSLAILNRKLPVPTYSHQEANGVLTITTDQLKLSYTTGQPFTAQTLSVVGTANTGFNSWNAGMTSDTDPGNLFGTIRTLDGQTNEDLNCTAKPHEHCEFGLISRSGWALINDSVTPVLDENDWWTDNTGTVYQRAGEIDWYLLAHGLQYKKALLEYTSIGGKVPLVPRYITGVWYTRWYNYNDYDSRREVEAFRSRSIPLDVWVYDMNWHQKNDWTGYTLDDALFPLPEDTFGWLKAQGLAISGNLHDASGIGSFEARYNDFAKAMGQPATGKTFEFTCANRTYMTALEDVMLQPLEQLGFDYWWIDWQQGEFGYGTLGGKMNPTIWTDKLRVTDHKRRNIENNGGKPDDTVTRGTVFARFGGLGNHRYQVGFSGDVNGLTWSNLAYQPYFTMTASNVLFGFWSHDIVGPGNDNEMYVRWIQWAIFSGVTRLHDRGMSHGGCYTFPTVEGSCPIVEPWNVPRSYMEANRAALQLREEMIPYIYTQYRHAHDTGLSIIRPLYYDYPEDQMAYAGDRFGHFVEYMFGDDMLVAPVVSPSGNTTMTNVTYYLPRGVWVEWGTGSLLDLTQGGQVISRNFALTEIPVYVKGGAVIPLKPCCESLIGGAAKQYTTLVFAIFPHPSSNSGQGSVYEDNGKDTAYLKGSYAWTTASYTRTVSSATSTLTCTITTQGTFPELPAQRRIVLKIVNGVAATRVTVNGADVPFSRYGGDNSWSYQGTEMTLVVETGVVSTSSDLTIKIDTPAVTAPVAAVKGIIQHADMAKRNLDETETTPRSSTGNKGGAELSRLAMYGQRFSVLASDATSFLSLLQNVTAALNATITEVNALSKTQVLTQCFSPRKSSHVTVAGHSCQDLSSDYSKIRVEGYLPCPAHPDAVPLARACGEYSPQHIESEQSPTFILSAKTALQNKNIRALSLFVHPTTRDAALIASEEGRDYVTQHGYVMANATVGYVFATRESAEASLGVDVTLRVNYSQLLLTEAARWYNNSNLSDDERDAEVLANETQSDSEKMANNMIQSGMHMARQGVRSLLP